MKFLKHRIADKRILRLISKWLKAGVLEEGKLLRTSTGTPQGGVISPILANVYLHYAIDLWATKVVPKHMRGQMHSIRYADDCRFASSDLTMRSDSPERCGVDWESLDSVLMNPKVSYVALADSLKKIAGEPARSAKRCSFLVLRCTTKPVDAVSTPLGLERRQGR